MSRDGSLGDPVHPQVAADRGAALGVRRVLETELDGRPDVGALVADSREQLDLTASSAATARARSATQSA